MMDKKAIALVGGGLVAAMLLMSRKVSALPGAVLTHAEAISLVNKTLTDGYFPGVPAIRLLTVIEIESARDVFAIRAEPGIKDFSAGLTQTLIRTAADMYTKGWSRYPKPAFTNDGYAADDIRRVTESSAKILFDPDVSAYYGAAYLQWLAIYPGGPHSEEWIIRAYNGGPGWQKSKYPERTAKHWQRYQTAKARLQSIHGGLV